MSAPRKITKKSQEEIRKATERVATGAGPRVPIPAQRKPSTTRKVQTKQVKDPVERSDRMVRKGYGHGDQNITVKEVKRKVGLLKELIEPLTPALVQICSDIAHDKKVHAAVRLDAATRLLDRAFGKPKEHVVVEDAEGINSEDEVRVMLNRILESVGAPKLESPDHSSRPPNAGNAGEDEGGAHDR